MWQNIRQRWRAAIAGVLTHSQRVWVVSRHDNLASQDIGMVNEAEINPHYWQRRHYSEQMIARIERLPVGGVLELQLADGCETVMRVK